MIRSVTFLTIGQTPRSDLVPELLSWLPDDIDVDEIGALDGMDPAAVAALAPSEGEPRLVTRMADGSQAIARKTWVQDRLQEILMGLESDSNRMTVLLCTGDFPGLHAPGLFVDAQHLVDHGAAGLCAGMRRIGLLLPLAEQEAHFHYRPGPGQTLTAAFASPYEDDDFAAAGVALSDCDAVVMHCIGYTDAQREQVADASGRPVLLARRLVASAVAQLL